MGNLERETSKKIRRTKINSAIIAAVATAGILTVAAIAPNVLGSLARTPYVRQRKYLLKSSLNRLISAGYVRMVEREGKKYVELTEKGERFAELIEVGSLVPQKPKRWDGKWRLLIFDIPEWRKHDRERIRTTLRALGFLRLQDSVWVHPYDCEDYIAVLKADLRIGKDVLYIIAHTIEYDAPLRKHFELSARK